MAYKHEYDTILTRLVSILSRLNDGESLSTKTLAEEFNVSDRTIQRDFNERLSSFPIYQDNKKWKMQDGYKLEKATSIEDQITLDILAKITENIGGNFATRAHRLLSKIKNEDYNPIYTKLNIEDISDKFTEIQQLERSIKERKVINCVYNNEREKPLTETLKPLRIVNFEGFWYLLALDKDDYVKKLYLKNTSNIQITDEAFVHDTKIDTLLENSISIWFQSDRDPFEVKIHADSTAAKYFKRRPLPTQSIDSVHKDGSMEFVVTITYEMEIIPIIKYWIPHLNIVEPTWVQEMINEDLADYSKKQTFSSNSNNNSI